MAEWRLEDGPASAAAAAIVADPNAAWRQLTGAKVEDRCVTATGPAVQSGPLLEVRGIIV